MRTEEQDTAEVNRLHEILVEEVSLVDHAANKHRFLIVKRSNDMSDNTENNEHDDNEDPIIDLDDEEKGDTADDDSTEDNAGESGEGESPAALALAVEALEGLTRTVELLGNADNENAKPQLVELATELRGVSDQLVSMAGASNDNDSASAAKNTAKSDDSLASTLAAVRAALQQLGNTLRPPGGSGKFKEADDKRSSSSGNIGGHLETLTGELRTLATTVKEQQQRIARLEKRAGVPNSKPVGEKRKRVNKNNQDSDEGWPMDMNRSLDRDSVDKSVSFHDV